VPGDIRYPTDLSLLNEGREKLEEIIDTLHADRPKGATKPRTYRQRARKDFLTVIKKRRASTNKIRKAIRKQLGYLRRNLRHIEQLAAGVGLKSLSRQQYRNLLVTSEVFRQQALMYEAKHHRMSGRIVSISQPHIRPIVRGKAGTPVEFGMKISSANIDGYLFIDRCSWDPYNESGDLVMQAEKYKQRYGVYPESIHADQIYRTRDNRTWCTERGIRLSGPPLGRPPKDPVDNRERKKLARQDELDRIAVEGTFGRAKRRYSMGRLMTALNERAGCQLPDGGLVDMLVEGEVKAGDGLLRVQPRTADAQGELAVVPPDDLIGEQIQEELGVFPFFLHGLGNALFQGFQNA
jgi:IS5 family transposase